MASMSGGQDRRAFPEFYAEYDTATGLGKRLSNRVVVNEPISYSGQGQVGRDIRNITAGLTIAKRQYPTLAGFLPVVAPASALPGAKIEHYKDEEAYLFALAEALHQEYRAIVDAGLYVQIDDAFLPYRHERMVPPCRSRTSLASCCRCAPAIIRSRPPIHATPMSGGCGRP